MADPIARQVAMTRSEWILDHLAEGAYAVTRERQAARQLAARLGRDPEPLMPPYDAHLLALVRDGLALLAEQWPPSSPADRASIGASHA